MYQQYLELTRLVFVVTTLAFLVGSGAVLLWGATNLLRLIKNELAGLVRGL